jgi:hypothetical protein
MSNKTLSILGIVAVVMVVLAAITSKMAQTGSDTVKSAFNIVQGLDPARIAKIVITEKDNTLEIIQQGKNFLVAEKDNYPASIKSVNELIAKVLDIKANPDILTKGSENYADLMVADDNAEKIIKFLDSDGKVITGVIIGKQLDSGDTAIRLVNKDEVYTSSSRIWMNTSAIGFMETKIISDAADKIVKVSVKYDGGSYEMTRQPGESNISFVTALPAGKQLKGKDYEQVFSALSNLNFSDVMAEAKAGDMKFDTTYVCQLDDSTVYTFLVAAKDGNYFVKCSNEFTDLSQIQISQTESQDELKKKETKLLARDNAAKFNAAHKGWVYEIASNQAENLTKKLDVITEDVPVAQPVDVNDVNDVNDIVE